MAPRRVPPLLGWLRGIGAPEFRARATSRGRARGGRDRAALRSGTDGRFRLLIDAHEAQVVVGDLLCRVAALDGAVEEALQRVPPDRAADREADVALHRSARTQPLVDLLVARAAPEHHAHDVLAALARAGLLREGLAVGLLVDALDLPDVHLDPEVLDLLDRLAHELGAQLPV